MKKRMISMLLCLSILLSMLPVSLIRAEAAKMWFYPALSSLPKDSRGGLQDLNGDGTEELIVLYDGRYISACMQVWALVNGGPVCVLDEEWDYDYGNQAYFSRWDAADYLVLTGASGGSAGGTYCWRFYDPRDSFRIAHTVIYSAYYDTGLNYSLDGEEISKERYDEIIAAVKGGICLADGYEHGKTRDQLAAMEPSAQLSAYSQNRDLSILPGQELELLLQLTKHGEVVSDWQTPAFAIGNSDVICVDKWERRGDKYALTVTGITPGTSALTITDGETKAFVGLTVTVVKEDPNPYSYFFTQVPSGYPEVFGDRKTQTNFYNFNGLYVNSYKHSTDSLGNHIVSFNVYNSSNMYGSVDIYDAKGNWVGCERIDKFQDPVSLYEVGENTFFLVKDLVTLNSLSYTADSCSKKTAIKVEVPKGGYLVISNNFQQSPGTYLYNSIDLMITGTHAVLSLFIDVTHIKAVQDEVINVLTGDDAFIKAFINQFTKIARNTVKELSYDGIAESVGACSAHAGQLFESLDLDFWGIVSTVTNIGQEVFLQVTMAEVAAVMKGMFAVNKYLNLAFQISDMKHSANKPQIFLHSTTQPTTYTISGVTVTPEENSLPQGTMLQVFRLARQDSLTVSELGIEAEDYLMYNICFSYGGQEYQPNKPVTVQLPIPEDFDRNRCAVLHQRTDGSWELMDFRMDQHYIWFTADHFSLFALVQLDESIRFLDVTPDKWFAPYVAWAVEEGITNGVDDLHFGPDSSCSRNQVVTFLWRAAGSPEPASQHNPFVDVKPGDYFYKAVLWAVEKGITTGIDETHFAPNDTCTRAQVAMFLWRTLDKPMPDAVINPFRDVLQGQWFLSPVLWAVDAGITNGIDDTHFAPDSPCTRAQIVTFLHRALA